MRRHRSKTPAYGSTTRWPDMTMQHKSLPDGDANQDDIEAFLVNASDDEIMAWARANNVDVDFVVGKTRAMIIAALARHPEKD
jgi:hypothetical protein